MSSTAAADRLGVADAGPSGQSSHPGMLWVPGGTFRMGSDHHYPEERPAHLARVDGFWIDRTPVTNREFRTFADSTGYRTLAEIAPDPRDYPGALPEMLKPGSMVFSPPVALVSLEDWSQWWEFRFGACWYQPYGPESSLEGLDEHPVVHVAWCDVQAYANWAGKELPTEAEWEFSARGGLEGAEFAWGHEFTPQGRHMANTWQGKFPLENALADGYARTSPVTAFPPNGYGAYDMIGNVWEWTSDWYSATHRATAVSPCCTSREGAGADASCDARLPGIRIPRRVVKGGSHLCAPNYCRRYRPSARHAQPIDTSSSHIGFRCILRPR